MSTYYVYSVEPMPRVDLFGKGYNSNNDYISFNGIHLDPIAEKTWTKIPDRFKSLRHLDRADKQGHVYHVFADEIVKANQERLRPRGVVFLDHEPTPVERTKLEKDALEANIQFRMERIQEFEDALREKSTGNPARTKPTVYEMECYEVLGMERPGSASALQAQRDPGAAVTERFISAMEALLAKLNAGGTSAAKATSSKPAASA